MPIFRDELRLARARVGDFVDPNPSFAQVISTSHPQLDVTVIGSGCSLPVAGLIAHHVRESCGRAVRAITPLEFVTETPRARVAVFVSSEGQHAHTLAAARHLHSDARAVVITNRPHSPLTESLSEKVRDLHILVSRAPPSPGGYIPVERPLALLGRVFGQSLQSAVDHTVACEAEVLAQTDRLLRKQTRPLTVIIIHGGPEEPAAKDLETRLLETGLLFPNVTDVWNFAHGRFNATALDLGTVFVAFWTGVSKQFVAPALRVIEPNAPVVRLGTDAAGILALLTCYLKSLEFVACLAETRGLDTGAITSPDWGRRLYEDRDL